MSSGAAFALFAGLCVSLAASTPINPTHTCPENTFWDVGTDRCENCFDYCHDAVARRMTETCTELCPVYVANAQAAKQQNSAEESNLKPNSEADADHSALSGSGPPSVPVVAVVAPIAALLLLVVVVVGAVFGYRRRRNTPGYKPAPVQEEGGTGQNKLVPGGKSSSYSNIYKCQQHTPIYKPSSLGNLPSQWV